MNGDAFKRARPGQKLHLSATAWNACLDAAEAHKQGPPGNNGGPVQFRQADIVLVKNASGSAVGRFEVLGINDVIITPSDSQLEFQQQVAFIGITPNANVHRGKFVICLDAIDNGQIGRAWVSGVCQVRVDIKNLAHRFCDVTNASTFSLQSSSIGTARILYKQPVDDILSTPIIWCVVRLGDDAGPVLRIGKYAGTEAWQKNTLRSVILFEEGTPPGETAGGTYVDTNAPFGIPNVVNHWGPVYPGKWVGVQQAANGYYYIVVAEC